MRENSNYRVDSRAPGTSYRERDPHSQEKPAVALAHSRRWCARLGVALILLGGLALAVVAFGVSSAVTVLGLLILVSGVAECAHAFHLRRSGPFFFHLVPGVAGISIGMLIVIQAAGDTRWTLLFASLFIVVGLFRLLVAIRLAFRSWQWAATDGAVTLLLGVLLLSTKPWWGPTFVCVAVGVSLILRGWSLVMFGRASRDQHAMLQTRPSRPVELERRQRIRTGTSL